MLKLAITMEKIVKVGDKDTKLVTIVNDFHNFTKLMITSFVSLSPTSRIFFIVIDNFLLSHKVAA